MDERMERFFRDALTRSLAPGLGAALVPRVRGRAGGQRSSASSTAGRVGLYNSGFDPAHARLAPGHRAARRT